MTTLIVIGVLLLLGYIAVAFDIASKALGETTESAKESLKIGFSWPVTAFQMIRDHVRSN